MRAIAKYWTLMALAPALLLGPIGCETMGEHKVASGAAIGAATGAVAGGIIGNQSGNKWEGAAIGAAAGAALGAGVGWIINRQTRDLEKVDDIYVEKHEPVYYPKEQYPDSPPPVAVPEHLTINIQDEVLFERGSSALTQRGTAKIAEIAAIISEYPNSRVIVKGYASSDGSDAANLTLSENRAKVVANHLIANKVDRNIIEVVGMGESDPIGDNSTEAGRAMNRRVEIEVYPDKSKQ